MEQEKIAAILKQNLFRRQKYLQQNKIEAYRLYDRENPKYPLAIDIYKNNAVLHVFDQIPTAILKDFELTLQGLLKISQFFYKDRTKQELKLPKSPHQKITVTEYYHQFLINLSDYLDTGLFLDHRETRKWIGEQSKGKIVLNTFAYTGSFTIYAATNGAKKTYSVDLSATYCDWIKKNLELNHLSADQNWVYKMDTLEFFKYAKRKQLQFDIIIIDPPTFSRNKNQRFSVQQDYPLLINAALTVLSPTGFILFSNNKRDFKIQKEKLSLCTVKNIQKQTYPPDFKDPQIHHCFLIEPA